MAIFLLIRHGENDFVKEGRLPGRQPGIHLNAHGQEQAIALAEALKGFPIKAIYTSPLERALETAGPLSQALGLSTQIRSGLMDTDVGSWQGLKIKELRKEPFWKLVHEQPSRFHFPGGESFVEMQARLVGEIEAIRYAHLQKDLLAVVFHADPIKLVIARFIGLPLDNFQKLSVAPGSVSILVLDKKGGQLAALNLTPPFAIPGSVI